MANIIEYASAIYPGITYNEYELESMFDDYLNEVEGVVTLLGSYEYNASEAIKRIDPILYRETYFGWLDAEGFDEIDIV